MARNTGRGLSNMDQSSTEELSPLLSSAGLFLKTPSISPIETGIGIEEALLPQETLSYISDPSTWPFGHLWDLFLDAEHPILVCSVSFK